MNKILSDLKKETKGRDRVVFVQGDFNILHSGHTRFLDFASSCGDYLIVAVNSDETGFNPVIPEKSRLAAIQAMDAVDYAFLLKSPIEDVLLELKPDVVVKGIEFKEKENIEKKILDSYGGTLMFNSGEVKFSDIEKLRTDLFSVNFSTITKPTDYLTRHHMKKERFLEILELFSGLNVVIIGDLIVDKYVFCDPVGMSQEDPTIVLRPLREEKFVGGAGIVASHASKMGANVSFFTVSNLDEASLYSIDKLSEYGVTSHFLYDETRMTTVKTRYQAVKKTLLRINQLRDHDLSSELCAQQFEKLKPALETAHLVIFSDFNYGALPQELVEQVTAFCNGKGIFLAADSQSSSQLGDISRYKNCNLVTPTEREARLALQDFRAGIVSVADDLMERMSTPHVLLTLGEEGVLVCNKCSEGEEGIRVDNLPAFNARPIDVSGAGDSLLTAASMSLAAGATIWEAAYMGSIAAACQVSRIGNTPLTSDEIYKELMI